MGHFMTLTGPSIHSAICARFYVVFAVCKPHRPKIEGEKLSYQSRDLPGATLLISAGLAAMSCFCMSNGQVAVAPMDEAVMKKSKNPTDMKAKAIEEHGHKEETHNEAVPHKTHKSTGGSQAHAFVRHLIHKADARCDSCYLPNPVESIFGLP